eukprot:12659232-Heterocapsa_arctica.AAC.1
MMTGMTSDLTKRIFNVKEKCIKEHGKNINGRTIYEFFKVDPNSGSLLGIEDLMAVVLHGMKLDEFLAEWDRVLIHMQEPPAQDVALA